MVGKEGEGVVCVPGQGASCNCLQQTAQRPDTAKGLICAISAIALCGGRGREGGRGVCGSAIIMGVPVWNPSESARWIIFCNKRWPDQPCVISGNTQDTVVKRKRQW